MPEEGGVWGEPARVDAPGPDARLSGASVEPLRAPGSGSAGSRSGAGDPVFWLDLQGRVSRWSGSAERLLGYPSREALQLRFADLFTPEDRAAHKPEATLAWAREFGRWEETGWRMSLGGDRIWAASTVSFARTPNGLEIGYQVVTHDLTPTDDSVEAITPRSEEVLRLLSMGSVASDVAHELNNLLAALRGFSCVLERHLPPQGLPHEAWRQMVHACDRGTDLTRKLLGIGKPGDAGLQAVDVAGAVCELEPLLRQVLPDRILLVTSFPPGLPRVTARARDIDSALLNLVVNARDAIEDTGTIAIQARLEQDALGAEPRVVISVRDSGMGMSPEVQRRAFERFFATKGPEQGTGLGLPLVRDAVRSWGGSVEVSSTPGSGTCVSLSLMPAEPAAVPQALEAMPEFLARRGTRAQVLVCAPPPTRDLVADLLTRRGYGVLRIDGPDDARRLFSTGDATVDVVVAGGPVATDQAADLVDALRQGGCPPAVVFSAAQPGSVTSPWSAYPACRFLWGPVMPDILVEEIERSLRAGRLSQATPVH